MIKISPQTTRIFNLELVENKLTKLNLSLKFFLFFLEYEYKTRLPDTLPHQEKRFYNRETNSAAFCVIQQMSIEPPFL